MKFKVYLVGLLLILMIGSGCSKNGRVITSSPNIQQMNMPQDEAKSIFVDSIIKNPRLYPYNNFNGKSLGFLGVKKIGRTVSFAFSNKLDRVAKFEITPTGDLTYCEMRKVWGDDIWEEYVIKGLSAKFPYTQSYSCNPRQNCYGTGKSRRCYTVYSTCYRTRTWKTDKIVISKQKMSFYEFNRVIEILKSALNYQDLYGCRQDTRYLNEVRKSKVANDYQF